MTNRTSLQKMLSHFAAQDRIPCCLEAHSKGRTTKLKATHLFAFAQQFAHFCRDDHR